MDYAYPVGTLSERLDLGNKSLGKKIYPYIVEYNTLEIKHEVPRIFYRVLLENRLKEEEKFAFEFVDYSSLIVDSVKDAISDKNFRENGITFVDVPCYKSLQASIQKILKERGFVPNDSVNKFIQSKPSSFTNGKETEFMLVFSNAEKKNAVAVGSMEQGTYPWNVIAALSSVILPWYFEKPLTEEERRFVGSLDRGEAEFLKIAKEIFNRSKACSLIENYNLEQMFIKAKEKLIANDENIIESARIRMQSCTETFNACAKQIRDASMHKMGILNSDGGFSEAFVNLMTKNSHLKIIRWENNNPVFEVGGYLLQLSHLDALEKYVGNPTYSIYYNSNQSGLEFGQKQKLMEAVFFDRLINIPICSTFCFDLSRNKIYTVDGLKEPEVFKNSVRNPHHKYYNCLGNNEPKMTEYLASGDYANAIIQAQGCVPFWNVGDEAVTQKFTKNYLWNDDQKIYKLPDGTMANCVEAVAWLEKEEEN